MRSVQHRAAGPTIQHGGERLLRRVIAFDEMVFRIGDDHRIVQIDTKVLGAAQTSLQRDAVRRVRLPGSGYGEYPAVRTHDSQRVTLPREDVKITLLVFRHTPWIDQRTVPGKRPIRRDAGLTVASGGVDQTCSQIDKPHPSAFDVSDVEPMVSVTPMQLRRRADVVSDGNQQARVLANAPDAREGFFAVPKVVE